MSISIGPYTAGEIPAPIVVTFRNFDQTAMDLSAAGWVGRWVIRAHKPGNSGEFTSADPAATTLSSSVDHGTGPTKGQVTYTWTGTDLTPGDFEGEMWIGNGTNRFASERFTWTTRSAIAIPNI